jgi:hypothetical protein
MYADESRNEILLNDDVRFLGNVLLESDKTFGKGDPINFAVLTLYSLHE